MCVRAANTFFVFGSVPDQYKTQEMCDKAVDVCYKAQEIKLWILAFPLLFCSR